MLLYLTMIITSLLLLFPCLPVSSSVVIIMVIRHIGSTWKGLGRNWGERGDIARRRN